MVLQWHWGSFVPLPVIVYWKISRNGRLCKRVRDEEPEGGVSGDGGGREKGGVMSWSSLG